LRGEVSSPELVKNLNEVPLLVVSAQGAELLGIVTAFDLL